MDSKMNEVDEILHDGFSTLNTMNEQVESILSTVRVMADGEHKAEVENKLLALRATNQAYRERVLQSLQRKRDTVRLAESLAAMPHRAIDG
jgi:hypothetical protein